MYYLRKISIDFEKINDAIYKEIPQNPHRFAIALTILNFKDPSR